MGRIITVKIPMVRWDWGCRSLMNSKVFTGDQQNVSPLNSPPLTFKLLRELIIHNISSKVSCLKSACPTRVLTTPQQCLLNVGRKVWYRRVP